MFSIAFQLTYHTICSSYSFILEIGTVSLSITLTQLHVKVHNGCLSNLKSYVWLALLTNMLQSRYIVHETDDSHPGDEGLCKCGLYSYRNLIFGLRGPLEYEKMKKTSTTPSCSGNCCLQTN